MRKTLRTIARRTAWLSGLAAAALFVVGVFMQDGNPTIRYVWQGSAITGLLAFGIETWVQRIDDRESQKAVQQLREESAEEIGLLQERLDNDKRKQEGRIKEIENAQSGHYPPEID